MTIEEAKKMIENDKKIHHDHLSGQYRHALTMAIEALEKQIPKRVKEGRTEHYNMPIYLCPDCENPVARIGVTFPSVPLKFCDNCGQKLDWGDEE